MRGRDDGPQLAVQYIATTVHSDQRKRSYALIYSGNEQFWNKQQLSQHPTNLNRDS